MDGTNLEKEGEMSGLVLSPEAGEHPLVGELEAAHLHGDLEAVRVYVVPVLHTTRQSVPRRSVRDSVLSDKLLRFVF